MKVSIITVCFNSAETIEDTIKSVLSQDYENIEYIIVDGESSDGTLDILKKYRGRVHKYISEPDNGVYDAMNKGIELATGEILGFLNSGDVYVAQTVIGQIVKSIQTHNADCCYGDLEYVAENNPSKTVRRWKSQPYRDGLFEKGWHPPHPTFFAKKSIFDKYGGFDISYDIGADYELMLRFLKKHGIKSCYIPSVLVKMRTGGKSNSNLWHIIKANIECYKAWKKNGLKVSPLIMLRKPFSKLAQCRVKGFFKLMGVRLVSLSVNVILINAAFLLAFLLRYGLSIPEQNFLPYKKSFVFLTLIYISALLAFKVYKKRFKSSWDLFRRVFLGLFLGTLLCVSFVYVFRIKWGAFPTSVFVLSSFINLLLIFKFNQFLLKAKKKIRKQVIILGEGNVDDIVGKKANVERKRIDQIRELLEYSNVDEIIVSEKITNAKDLNLLLYLQQKLKADILFSPLVYMELLPEIINGSSSIELLSTFVGRQPDFDEFSMRMLDIAGSIGALLVLWPAMLLISLLIKLTSSGPVLYKQQRVGKDGKTFTLYKFRTMVKNAEKMAGFSPATENDPRVTKIGKWLRITRLDEIPQLLNVLKGQMSLVGPRPENLYRVENHEALQSLRLAVKPGLTGLAQIRSFYDLHPKHKIKYDYLYIQRRSLALNIYILLQTIPVVFSKKGW